MLRAFRFVLLALLLTTASAAQEDKATARALYTEGLKLQADNKPDKALEKFEAANRNYDKAPTIKLRIAQCQASVGKLVEASETYKVIENMPRKEDWSPDFVQAQQQAKAENSQLEPRIPKLTVTVEPHPPGTKLQVDGAEWDAALLGVARAINPGKHRVIAFAPNFSTAEDSVDIKEKDQRTVALKLAVSTDPAGANGQPPPLTGQPPAGTTTPATGTAPATPPVVAPPPPKVEPSSAIMIGAGVLGGIAGAAVGNDGLSDAQVGFELFAGARFSKFVLELRYNRLQSTEATSDEGSNFLGIMLGLLGRYDSNGIWFALGGGVRGVGVKGGAGEGSLEIGYSVHLAKGFRVIPKGFLNVGKVDTLLYGIVGLGLSGQFDALPLGK
jgi:hypothetical protein